MTTVLQNWPYLDKDYVSNMEDLRHWVGECLASEGYDTTTERVSDIIDHRFTARGVVDFSGRGWNVAIIRGVVRYHMEFRTCRTETA